MSNKPITYAKIENGELTGEQKVSVNGNWSPPEGEDWRPVIVEIPEAYNRTTHHETGRGNRIEADRVVRYRIIEPIQVTAEMVKAEAQRRIIEYTGGGDMMGSLAKQINANGAMQPEIDRLRAKSNEIEAMNPIPIEFREESYWA